MQRYRIMGRYADDTVKLLFTWLGVPEFGINRAKREASMLEQDVVEFWFEPIGGAA